MSNELAKQEEIIVNLSRLAQIVSVMLEFLKRRQDGLIERSETQHKLIGHIIELIELDREISDMALKELKDLVEEDQVEMADDITEQFDELKGYVRSVTHHLEPDS
ncbi:MAG: hypothetical protein OXF62_14355 [Caldilineaceae bacterium]|nr:hypothetical protein [Caldilineaceae bacterium]